MEFSIIFFFLKLNPSLMEANYQFLGFQFSSLCKNYIVALCGSKSVYIIWRLDMTTNLCALKYFLFFCCIIYIPLYLLSKCIFKLSTYLDRSIIIPLLLSCKMTLDVNVWITFYLSYSCTQCALQFTRQTTG